MPRPGLLVGALVGAMLTAALIAVLSLAFRLVGVPFIPFEVFDWTARVLPGAVITFGIDAMVTVIRVLDIGPTSEVAKLAEQAMAIGGLVVTGVLAGLFAFRRAAGSEPHACDPGRAGARRDHRCSRGVDRARR